MHVHSILWFAAAIAAVTVLYRSLLNPLYVAGLAAFLYTIDESFYVPVAWISNRNSLIALFFGLLAILFHHRWRSRESRLAAVLSSLFLLCCVLSKEFGVSIAAYYVAYACFVEKGDRIQRALSLVPSLALLSAWKLLHGMMGYGIMHTGYYTDPLLEPVAFAGAALERAPVLLFSQWSIVAASLNSFLAIHWQGVLWWIAVSYLAILFITMLPLLREDRMSRFWGTGMLLSLVPAVCTNLTEDRYLLFVGIGAMGLAAQFIAGVCQGAAWLPKGRSLRIAFQSICFLLIFTHVVGAGVERVIRPVCVFAFDRYFFEPTLQVPNDPALENQDLVIVNAPNPAFFVYFPFMRSARRASIPRAVRILSPAFGPIEVIRTGEDELMLRSPGGSLLSAGEASELAPANSIIRYVHDVYGYSKATELFRKRRCGMKVGERVVVGSLTVEVLEVGENRCPKAASFAFPVPLDSNSLRWLQWDWRTMSYLPFTVPEVGKSVIVRGVF